MSWGTTKNDKGLGLSKETQAFLQDSLKQKGLSQRALQDVADSIQRGDSKWVDHVNTGVSSYRAAASTKSKVKVPKVGVGSARAPMPGPPARFSGIKLQSEILRDNPPEREQYMGGPLPADRDKEKQRLNLVFEHGAEKLREMEEAAAAAAAAREERARRPPRPLDVKEQMIDQIVDEIRERREFLENLQAMGAHSRSEAQVREEIAVRLGELQRLGMDVGDTRYLKPRPTAIVPGLVKERK